MATLQARPLEPLRKGHRHLGLLLWPTPITTGVFSTLRTVSIPSTTRPNTTCLPSSQSALAHVMKNCEPFVSGAERNRRPLGRGGGGLAEWSSALSVNTLGGGYCSAKTKNKKAVNPMAFSTCQPVNHPYRMTDCFNRIHQGYKQTLCIQAGCSTTVQASCLMADQKEAVTA